MTATLTATAVKNAKPASARRELPDGSCPGLYMVVEPTGSKRWALRYRRPNGDPARLVLGSVYVTSDEPADAPAIGGHLTLASARRLVATLRHEIAQGRDPGKAHITAKQQRRADGNSENTFAAAACGFIERHAKKNIRRWREHARLLGIGWADGELISKGLSDRWGDKLVTAITSVDIDELLREVRKRGVPGAGRRSKESDSRARHMLVCLSTFFTWLMDDERIINSNPCSGLSRPKAPKARERVLNKHEVIKFWQAADAVRPEFGGMLKLLLLTGCRLREVADMRRSEMEGSQWTIPGMRTKNRRPHVVPLPQFACDIVAAVPTEDDLVFTTNGRSPVSGFSKLKRALDRAMKISAWRLHDLRRTAVTGMAELGIRPDVIELAINHVSGSRGGIAGVYNRSELLPERRAALERWAAHVDSLVSGKPAKIIPLRGGA